MAYEWPTLPGQIQLEQPSFSGISSLGDSAAAAITQRRRQAAANSAIQGLMSATTDDQKKSYIAQLAIADPQAAAAVSRMYQPLTPYESASLHFEDERVQEQAANNVLGKYSKEDLNWYRRNPTKTPAEVQSAFDVLDRISKGVMPSAQPTQITPQAATPQPAPQPSPQPVTPQVAAPQPAPQPSNVGYQNGRLVPQPPPVYGPKQGEVPAQPVQTVSTGPASPADAKVAWPKTQWNPEGNPPSDQDASNIRKHQDNPAARAAFDKKYGDGATDKLLGTGTAKLDTRDPNWWDTGGPTSPPTDEELKADREYLTKDLQPYRSGGVAEGVLGLRSLERVKYLLEHSPEGTISGPEVGLGVKTGMKDPKAEYLTRKIYGNRPFEAAAAHRRAVISSLRPLVGARAAAQIYDNIINATYDPSTDQKDNARRIGMLIDAIKEKSREAYGRAKYYDKYHTLSGFKGGLVDIDALDADILSNIGTQ